MSETMAASAGVSQTPVLHLDSIRKSFGSTTVLNGISFDVNQHEVVALLGPSGSGKSTLMKCVNLLERVDDGQIWLGDTDITNPRANQDKIRSRIGVVFQQFNLFAHMTVLQNVMLGPVDVLGVSKEEARERAMDLLSRVGVAEQADKVPAQLSGGQQQRLCIARTLALNPDVILFDEPCSALDPISTLAIEDLMSSIVADRAIVIVTHNMEQASRVSNRTAFFYMGDMVEYDETDEIFQRPKDKRLNDYLTGMFS